MTSAEFDDILAMRIDKIRTVLSSKAVEYASSSDRLHNFKRAAALSGRTTAQALVGMWTKHLVSVLDIVDEDAHYAGPLPISRAFIDEKISDAINYLILLEAILIERTTTIPKPDTTHTGDH